MNIKFIGWNFILILFALYLVVSLIGVFQGTVSVENGMAIRGSTASALLNLFLHLFLALAVFGYAYQKRILKQTLWKLLFPVILIWGLLQAYNTMYRADDVIQGLAVVVVFAIPSVLGYIALYRYSFTAKWWR